MYWEILYWSGIASTPVPLAAVLEDISFEWYWLQNAQIKSDFQDPFASGSVSYNTTDIPQDDWKIYQSRFWREKTIKLTWTIVCASQTELEAKIDEIKSNISTPQGLFKYKRADWTYREIHATLVNENIKRESYHITWIPFELEFKANDPFWRDSAPDSRIYSGVNSSPFLESITNTGNESSKPTIYFAFSAATSVTSVAVTIQWRTITWTGTIAAGDMLIIDSLNKQVTLNWTLQDFSWTFPELAVHANAVTFTINGTFTCDISAVFFNNYR